MIKVIIFLLFGITYLLAQQNPHGSEIGSCIVCHKNSTWSDVSGNEFDHNTTGFILEGAHKAVYCTSCHESLVLSKINNNCNSCHTDVHKGELGETCDQCHSEFRWDERTRFVLFHNQTNFPLTGVHASLDCESCHHNEQQRQFANTPVACSGCHLNLFMTTLEPDHQKADFDLSCQNCHLTNANSWQESVFTHSVIFPLTGGHAGLDCIDCHGENYNLQRIACVDCHQSAFEQAINPDHQAFSLSTDCESCHTGISWQKTTFNHFNVSGLSLAGRHFEALCIDCHQNNQLSGLPLECAGCHQQEYDAANDPNHTAALFPTLCENCHSTNGWRPANWDHDSQYFPIYSGRHRNEWDTCADCHLNEANYAQFECIFCHAHRQSKMDSEHHNRRNYVFESQACLNCHPKGHE